MKKLIAILLALVLLASCGESESETALTPNEHFGMVEEVYSLGRFFHADTVPASDVVSNTDEVTPDGTVPTFAWSRGIFESYTGSRSAKSALVLRLQLTSKRALAHTRLEFADGVLVGDYEAHSTGTVEKLIGGEWHVIGSARLDLDRRLDVGITLPFIGMSHGEQYATVDFPLHEPGEYRMTYYFRDLVFDGLVAHTGDELYEISHTYTVPEASEKKFDVVSVEMDGGARNLEFAVLCRSNDGTIPYQDLAATRLEVHTPNGWQTAVSSDGTPAAKLLYDYELEHPDVAPAAYTVDHPCTGEEVTNLFAGTALLDIGDYSDAAYRLTLEFCENADGSGERYALQLNLDLSWEDEQ